LFLLAGMTFAHTAWQASPANAGDSQAAETRKASPAQLFQAGQDALAQGKLDEAERNFRQVLQADPQAGAAYANLGVVYMRRKQWSEALESLQKGGALDAAGRRHPAQYRTCLLPAKRIP
jgi:Tfp pilus assembly protein PilF